MTRERMPMQPGPIPVTAWRPRPALLRTLAALAAMFGLLTLSLGAAVGHNAARAAAGNAQPARDSNAQIATLGDVDDLEEDDQGEDEDDQNDDESGADDEADEADDEEEDDEEEEDEEEEDEEEDDEEEDDEEEDDEEDD